MASIKQQAEVDNWPIVPALDGPEKDDPRYAFGQSPRKNANGETLTMRTWFKDLKVHRDDDSPASIDEYNHTLWWMKEGSFHRDNGPARMDRKLGISSWHIKGILHRSHGPAMIFPYESKSLLTNGISPLTGLSKPKKSNSGLYLYGVPLIQEEREAVYNYSLSSNIPEWALLFTEIGITSLEDVHGLFETEVPTNLPFSWLCKALNVDNDSIYNIGLARNALFNDSFNSRTTLVKDIESVVEYEAQKKLELSSI